MVNKQKIKFNAIGDLGYISFFYGCRDGSQWGAIRHAYKNCLLLADHHSFRSDLLPDYKGRRKMNRLIRPEMQVTYDKVKRLREYIVNEDEFSMVGQVSGAESDDLVALFHLAYPDLKYIIAIDKDYLQLRDFNQKQVSVKMEPSPAKESFKRLPQYVTNSIDEMSPQILVLIHALFGDKSDSIPRLLSSHVTIAKQQWSSIMVYPSLSDKFKKAYELFRENFTLNLYLVVLPGNQLRNECLNPSDFLDELITGSYWDWTAWTNLIDQTFESISLREQVVSRFHQNEWADLGLN